MPLELVSNTFMQMPHTIIFDFVWAIVCASVARGYGVLFACWWDRFHWGDTYVNCSAAMSPDSHVSLDAAHTPFFMECNALSMRRKNHPH